MAKKYIQLAYNAFADKTSTVNRLAVVAPKSAKSLESFRKFELIAVQGHRFGAKKQLPISH